MKFSEYRKILENYRKLHNMQPYTKEEIGWLKSFFKSWTEIERLEKIKEIS